jgi:hypothetical protein
MEAVAQAKVGGKKIPLISSPEKNTMHPQSIITHR